MSLSLVANTSNLSSSPSVFARNHLLIVVAQELLRSTSELPFLIMKVRLKHPPEVVILQIAGNDLDKYKFV